MPHHTSCPQDTTKQAQLNDSPLIPYSSRSSGLSAPNKPRIITSRLCRTAMCKWKYIHPASKSLTLTRVPQTQKKGLQVFWNGLSFSQMPCFEGEMCYLLMWWMPFIWGRKMGCKGAKIRSGLFLFSVRGWTLLTMMALGRNDLWSVETNS